MSINFSSYEIGRRALNAHQHGINVAGQNIANVNTPGYSRQYVQLAEGRPTSFNKNAVGTGVSIEGVRSFRDRFIESRLQTETGVSGRLSAKRDALEPVQNVLAGSETGGVNASMREFFGAFRDLETAPDSIPLRSVAVNKGESFAANLNTTAKRLGEIQTQTDGQLRATVIEINGVAKKIADLNNQISSLEPTGANVSSLRDERGELLKTMSELSGARSSENPDGTVNVTIGEGRSLVLGGEAKQLTATGAPPLGLAQITLDGEPATFSDGRAAGLIDAAGEISKQIESLDGLAASVAARVNDLHKSGTDLDGGAGTEFFQIPANGAPVTAANLKINPDIAANPRLVVASPLAQPAASGTVAGSIANLLTDTNSTVGARSGSFASIYNSITADAGEQVRSADSKLETQTALLSQITQQREAISGVSIDEEAIDLMQSQKAFEAAARFLRIADEMTQTILSLAQ